MWISYMIPRIEDGNNFGVSIQVNAALTYLSVFACGLCIEKRGDI